MRDLLLAQHVAQSDVAHVASPDHGGAQIGRQQALLIRPAEETAEADTITQAGGWLVRMELRQEVLNLCRLETGERSHADLVDEGGELGKMPRPLAHGTAREPSVAIEK